MTNWNDLRVNDAHDEPDTGKPPCDFCRREIPCECMDAPCMCTCGRCQAPGIPARLINGVWYVVRKDEQRGR